MKSFLLLPLALLASSAVAQTTTACGADYIVETCLSTEKDKLASCKTDEYNCECAAWQAILTCYNNCPNDPRQLTDAGQRDIFCGYASQYSSSAPTQAAATSKTSTAAKATDNAGQGSTGTGSEGATATSSGSGPAKTNSGADLVLNAGGVLAAVAGVVAVVL